MFDDVEAQLQDHLKEQLPTEVHVLTTADLAGAKESSQPTPAVHLVYQRYQVTETKPGGMVCRIRQIWLAVIAVRNVRDIRRGQAARNQATELARLTAQALMGFKPASATKPLTLVNAPQASYQAGHQYLPLAFAVETVLKAH